MRSYDDALSLIAKRNCAPRKKRISVRYTPYTTIPIGSDIGWKQAYTCVATNTALILVRQAADLVKVYLYNAGIASIQVGLDYTGCNLVEVAGASQKMSFLVPLLSGFTGSLKLTSLSGGTFVPWQDTPQIGN